MRSAQLSTLVLFASLASASPSWGYFGAIPTLGKIISESKQIAVLEVDKVSREKQVVIFKKVADLKGTGAPDTANHKLTDGFHPRESRTILDWAQPGRTAICFLNERACRMCIGDYWYECAATEAPWYMMTHGNPELAYVYRGSTAKLREHVRVMLEGRETIITALKYRLFAYAPGPGRWLERRWEHWDTNEAVGSRRLMRGKHWPVCRIKASLKMPNTTPELIRDTYLIIGDGPGTAEDVPALAKALEHAEVRVRTEAAEDLGLIGPAAAAAVAALLEAAAEDADPLVRLEAAKAVASIEPKNDKPLPMLIAALQHESPMVRQRAAECLGDLGPDAKRAVEALIKAAGDADPTVSWAAIDALGQVGPDAAPAVPTLVAALKDANLRGAAVDALGQIGRQAQAAIPVLEKMLTEDEPPFRWTAASALVRIGGAGVKPAVHYLLTTAVREQGRNGPDATNILMAPTSREALPVMLEAAGDPAIRDLAAQTAVEVSAYLTKDPLRDVRALLKDKDPAVRCVSAWVLYGARTIDIKDAINVQRETLKAADPWARRRAIGYLGSLGPSAKDAAEDVAALLEDKDADVREAAAKALERIGRQ